MHRHLSPLSRAGSLGWIAALFLVTSGLPSVRATAGEAPATRPNVILVMADDLGWGDVAYNGNTRVHTPVLDRLAREGVRLDRFYAGAPVCTPTRATCMTGRNPNRNGTVWAGDYPLPDQEITIAELFRDAGYRTGHFGKWHLGKMTPDLHEGAGFSDRAHDPRLYMPPWKQGFQTCFSIESATPSYNPAVWGFGDTLEEQNEDAKKFVQDRPIVYGEGTLVGPPAKRWPYDFWVGENQQAPDTIAGDSSKLIMNHAISFIEDAAKSHERFFATVWFVTPHAPVSAGPEFREPYAKLSMREQHWFGAISALDGQMGRLMEELKRLHLDENTIVWFCSDNGPSWVHELNSAGPMRGKKSELYEGGIRVPGIVRWPAGLTGGRVLDQPISTLDFLPTLVAAAGIQPAKLLPLDGENVLPVLRGETPARARPIYFDYPYRDLTKIAWEPTKVRQSAVIDGPWKILSLDDRQHFALYNLAEDIGERHDIASAHPEIVKRLRSGLEEWTVSAAKSLKGEDYK